jgi:hypothetical protein
LNLPETDFPIFALTVRTALLAIISFMPTEGKGAIGALDHTPEERKILAKRSLSSPFPPFFPPSPAFFADLHPTPSASTQVAHVVVSCVQQIGDSPAFVRGRA